MERAYKKMTSHGSINVPVAMRRSLAIEPKDAMVVEEKDGKIIISPYNVRCQFCGTTDGAGSFYGKGICPDCARKAYEGLKGGKL